MKLLFGDDEGVAGWVSERMPQRPSEFGPFAAIGVVDADGNPMAGFVFHDYKPDYGTIEISAAADTPRWATRNIVKGILLYPFGQLECNLAWTATEHTNTRAIRFNKGIGFTQEAVLRDRFGVGHHAVICRLLKRDFERIYLDGQTRTERTEAA